MRGVRPDPQFSKSILAPGCRPDTGHEKDQAMTATYHSLSTEDFLQDWSDTTLITTDDDWSRVPSIQGFRGDGLTGSTGADPQTITADGSTTPLDVIANQTSPNTLTSGGIAEFDGLSDPTVALQGSGTADAPGLVLYMDTTDVTGVTVDFDIRDIDGSSDDAIQAVAVQYRIGGTGDFINLPAAFTADATTGGSASLVTHVTAALPVAAENQGEVEIRIITANAGGSDEWVGIDNIAVTSGTEAETDGSGLLLSEIVVTPTGGEFIEIHNASDAEMDLSDVYLSDATFAVDGTYYYNLPTGSNAGGGGFSDFTARFAEGATIAAGAYVTVALAGSDDFYDAYGFLPDYELYEDGQTADGVTDMVEAFDGSINDQGGLTNGGEVVTLFSWDGESDLVTDLDYVLWGDTAEAVDKTGVSIDGPDAGTDASAYADDTAIADQDIIADQAHGEGESFQRIDMTEGTETRTGGNGAGGHDETSENLGETWTTAAVPPGAAAVIPDPEPEPTEITLISAIQGRPEDQLSNPQFSGPDNMDGSPMEGRTVTIEAIVVGDFQDGDGDDTRNLSGFYVQEEDADADGDASTSEGIFVYDPSLLNDVNVGDKVQVTGVVGEYGGETQIGSVSSIEVISTGNALPTAAVIDLSEMETSLAQDGSYQADLEAFEGMLVEFADTMTITEMYELDRFNQIVLSSDGRPEQYTQSNAPDATGYDLYMQELGQTTIVYDDGLNLQNLPVDGLVGFEDFGTDTAPSMGDTIDDLTGVLSYQWAGNSASAATWRVRATTDGENGFDDTNPREETPDDVGGDLTVATFNVLNFFTTLDTFGTVEGVGADQSQDPRGADTDPYLADGTPSETAEFDRQVEKLVTTLIDLDADVLGLLEIENDFLPGGLSPTDTDAQGDRGIAIQYLVDAINTELGAEVYAYVDPGQEFVGSDAIAVGYLYKIDTVSTVGEAVILDDAAFTDPNGTGEGKNRAALIQTFADDVTGETFTTALNHFKSKGDSGLADDDGNVIDPSNPDSDQSDGAGYWNDTRTQAAEYLDAYLSANYADDRTVILGDLNSYAMEDPITYLTSQGYTDLAGMYLGDAAYSYVFDGQIGTLDYALADEDFTRIVSGVTEWHINSDESDALDYNLEYGRDPDIYDASVPYRTSDHDPILVGIDLPGDVTIHGDATYANQVDRFATLVEALQAVSDGQAIDVSTLDDTPLIDATLTVDADIDLRADDSFVGIFQLGEGVIYMGLDGDTDSAVLGNTEHNRIEGSDGDNLLTGGLGMDVLLGGAGYDVLVGGLQADYLDGGADFDIACYGGSVGRVVVDLGAGSGRYGTANGDVLVNIEALTGSVFRDALTGDDGDNVLRGLKGTDWLSGGGGNDLLVGGQYGDTLIGGDGIDTASYARSFRRVSVDLASNDNRFGEAAGDLLYEVENLVGSVHGDSLRGDGADNLLKGLSGNDILGGRGGSDRLIGGLGDDQLTGGGGADMFVYQSTIFGNDRITDWQDGIDRIVGFGLDDFRITQDDDDTVLTLLADPFQTITLSGIDPSLIDASDFVCG
ncbi:MAG: hypothetical protein CML66_14780 [Rhodobacteraceae bacterium]|nr:hypothetical protein [Paracoccaceae bacterium]